MAWAVTMKRSSLLLLQRRRQRHYPDRMWSTLCAKHSHLFVESECPRQFAAPLDCQAPLAEEKKYDRP
jgi:hypothetical protein